MLDALLLCLLHSSYTIQRTVVSGSHRDFMVPPRLDRRLIIEPRTINSKRMEGDSETNLRPVRGEREMLALPKNPHLSTKRRLVLPLMPSPKKNRIHRRILLSNMRHPNPSSSHRHKHIQKSQNMHNMRTHNLKFYTVFHCRRCHEGYTTQEKAEKCFENHESLPRCTTCAVEFCHRDPSSNEICLYKPKRKACYL